MPARITRSILALAMTMLAATTAPALASTPAVTTQAQAADAAFLAYAPAPAAGAGALCLVDTGVDSNPDTQPGLISATAVDGGSGGDADPQGHGTTMAMIAGAAGNGMIGAWPRIKIVSVRATTVPSPGQEPTFEFDDYTEGMALCLQQITDHVDAIDLALSSTVPPSPDQVQDFENDVGAANLHNVAVVAAAGNTPGPIEQPASQQGVFAVGAGDPNNAICSFSATQGLTFYAPGCGLDEANPFTDVATCCGNGTSQASAFAAAVLVALMSYDPTLTYSRAEQLLISTAVDGHLDVTAAFDADGLSSIVAAGNAAVPQPPPTTTSTTTTTTSTSATKPAKPASPVKPKLTVTRAHWAKGVLTLVVHGLSAGRLRVQLDYSHHAPRVVFTKRASTRIRTARPRLVLVRVMVGKRVLQGPLSVRVT